MKLNMNWSHKFIYFFKPNGDGLVENGQKKKKKKNDNNLTLHVQRTCLNISLPLLLNDYDVNFSNYAFYLVGEKCPGHEVGNVVCPHKPSCSLSLSLPLIFTLLAA